MYVYTSLPRPASKGAQSHPLSENSSIIQNENVNVNLHLILESYIDYKLQNDDWTEAKLSYI